MKMRTNRLVILIMGLLFVLLFAETVSAQTVTAGVSKGETFDYSYRATWNSTDPTALPPNEFFEYDNLQQIQLRVKDISGATLHVDEIRSYKNGSQNIDSGSINLETSIYTVPYGFLIIGADLDKGQVIYPIGGPVITDTVTRSYSSGQRETNIISREDLEQKIIIYFDKKKGIAVEYLKEFYETSGGYSIVGTERLINTNSDVWSGGSGFPVVLLVVPVVVAVPLVVLLARRRRNRIQF